MGPLILEKRSDSQFTMYKNQSLSSSRASLSVLSDSPSLSSSPSHSSLTSSPLNRFPKQHSVFEGLNALEDFNSLTETEEIFRPLPFPDGLKNSSSTSVSGSSHNAATKQNPLLKAIVGFGKKLLRKSAAKVSRKIPKNLLGSPFRNVNDDYIIGVELGRGLYGVTRRVIERSTGLEFACKTVNKSRLTSGSFSRIQLESYILQNLPAHADVITFHDVYEDEHKVHFVMELCQGGTLNERLTLEKHLDEVQAVSVVRSIARAVQHLHSHGVIHRDLKLENFLFVSQPETEGAAEERSGDAFKFLGDNGWDLKMIDFGLSSLYRPGVRLGEIVGTAYYVAPEVLRKKYGKECDVWSVGVILYMLLSGSAPFWDVSEAGICDKILEGKYEMRGEKWDKVSREAKDLISRMLEMDVEKRITVPEILRHEWITMVHSVS